MTRAPAAAKLVGAGTRSPKVYVRGGDGRWVEDCICEAVNGALLVRRFEALADWAREEFLGRLLKHAALPGRRRRSAKRH